METRLRLYNIIGIVLVLLLISSGQVFAVGGRFTATTNITSGDVVVYSNSTAYGVGTTSTAAVTNVAGVATETVSSGERVDITLLRGPYVIVNVVDGFDFTATPWLVTSTTTGAANGVATLQSGVFGRALTSDGTPADNQVYATIFPNNITTYLSTVDIDTEAEIEAILGIDIFTANDGALADDDVTLSDVQSALSNDFHNVGGTDDDVDDEAIHDNVAGEILAVTLKGTPVAADVILAEDTEAANVKKRITLGSIPVTESQIGDLNHTDGAAIHDNTAGEIIAVTSKGTPIAADVVLIEDTEAGNAKKRVTLGSIPITESQIGDLDHTDSDAFHKSTTSEITALTEEGSPAAGVMFLAETAAGAKRKVDFANFPGAAGGEANLMENLGAAAEVYKVKTGTMFSLRTIGAAAGLYDGSIVTGYSLDGNEVVIGVVGMMHSSSGDAALTAEGQQQMKADEDGIARHYGSSGNVQGEAFDSIIKSIAVSFDPGTHYNRDSRRRLFPIGDEAPHGITIYEWKMDFGMNPSVEADVDLCYADDWAGTNETVLDQLDTTDGVSSDTSLSLFVPNGKHLYYKFGSDPEGDGDYLTGTFSFYCEED